MENLAKVRSYWALKILKDEFPQKTRFLDLYIRSLLRNPNSILYSEVEHNQMELHSFQHYQIPETDRLLYYLFHDAKVANELSIWKPIGDEILKTLEDRSSLSDNDEYNLGPKK